MSESKRAASSQSPPSPRAAPPLGLSEMRAAVPGPQSAPQPQAQQLSAMPPPIAIPQPAQQAQQLSAMPAPNPGPAAPVPAAQVVQALPVVPAAPRPRVPLTIDGRPAVHTGAAADGRRIFAPMRDPADPAAGTSPYPHYSEGVGGAPGHLSDLSVHQAPQASETVARMRQTYVAPLGGVAPASRNDRYVDTADGVMQRRAGGVFTPQDGEPLSPRTTGNAAARTDITFEPL
jgi:hypothetical protein